MGSTAKVQASSTELVFRGSDGLLERVQDQAVARGQVLLSSIRLLGERCSRERANTSVDWHTSLGTFPKRALEQDVIILRPVGQGVQSTNGIEIGFFVGVGCLFLGDTRALHVLA
jgi:hypothetical protein